MSTDRRRFLRAAGAAVLPAPIFAAPSKSILETVRDAETLEHVDVVDAHAHIDETPRDAIWPQGPDELIEDMDRCGVKVAVFSHLGSILATEADEYLAGIENSARAVQRHPGRLRSYLVFHPHLLQASRKQMERLLEPNSPFAGFKLHGAFHQYPAEGPNYRPVFAFAGRHGLPVLFHVAGTGRDWSHSVPAIADEFPGMRLILAHFGTTEEALPRLLNGRPNLFIDTCLSTGRHRIIERLAGTVGAGKLLFASDATYDSLSAHVAKVGFTELPEADKKLILGGNARRIFGPRLPG